VDHNHDLFPLAFADLLLSDELRDYVQELRRIGVSPLKIQFARQARGVLLSSGQIHNTCRPRYLKVFTDFSAELMNYVVATGGACWIDDEHIHDELAGGLCSLKCLKRTECCRSCGM
jgi:hypothetical protein